MATIKPLSDTLEKELMIEMLCQLHPAKRVEVSVATICGTIQANFPPCLWEEVLDSVVLDLRSLIPSKATVDWNGTPYKAH